MAQRGHWNRRLIAVSGALCSSGADWANPELVYSSVRRNWAQSCRKTKYDEELATIRRNPDTSFQCLIQQHETQIWTRPGSIAME